MSVLVGGGACSQAVRLITVAITASIAFQQGVSVAAGGGWFD